MSVETKNPWKESIPDPRSFLRVVSLDSPNGQSLLDESHKEGTSTYHRLITYFTKQKYDTTCSVVSTCISFNTLLGSVVYEEDTIWTKNGVSHVKEGLVKAIGMTLAEANSFLINLSKVHNFEVECTFAQDSNEKEFRESISSVISKGHAIILNYHPSTLLEDSEFSGHFSPVAAYNKKSDCVLVMDVWPTSPSMWVPITDLWHTTNTKDYDSKKSRGWIVVKTKCF